MKYIISFLLKKIPRKYLQLFSHIVLKVVSVFYMGNKVECPVCKKTFRKFLPYGRVTPRENALCPNCLTLERHRLMWLYLTQKTNFFTAPLKVLHVAPEICFIHRFEKLKNLDYVTADIESPLAKVKMDIQKIPFEPNTFDVTFCNHVMEHVEDDVLAMSELYRVLKPGGWAIIQSPYYVELESTIEDTTITDPAERERLFGQDDHFRKYGRDYGSKLKKAGFKITEDDFAAKLSDDQAHRFGITKDEIIFFCQKPSGTVKH